MTLLQAVALGALQGLTEFLPVSSSGHLVLARQLLQINEVPSLFDIVLHIATLGAVVVMFRSTIVGILTSLVRFIQRASDEVDKENQRLFVWLFVASVLTGVLGFTFSALHIESTPRIVALLFVVTGGILLVSRRFQGSVEYDRVGWKQAVMTGVAQGFGVFPGISRSGITISAALLSGMSREKAGEFSFLLAIPAILGALLVRSDEANRLMSVVTPVALTAGVLVAFVVGLLSLKLLLRLVKLGKISVFAFYLVPLGIVSFILL